MKRMLMVTGVAIVMLLVTASRTLTDDAQVRNQRIQELLVLSGGKDNAKYVMDQMMAGMQSSVPDVPKEFWDEVRANLDLDSLLTALIPIYASHFTDEEVAQLVAFYKSPIGLKLRAEQPALVRESMEAGQVWGRKVAAAAIVKLREKGYLK